MNDKPYIDAHCHIWTPDTDHYPLGQGFTKEDMQPPSFTAEELLATCRPHGVGRVNLIQMSFYGQPGKSSNIQNEIDNSYMLDMIKLYPERFVGTAIIDPTGPDPASAMAELGPDRGVRAFRIQPVFVPLPVESWLQHPGFEAMFAKGAETGQVLSCLINPDALPEVARMCRLFPKTKVIIDHLARIGGDGEIRDNEVETLCALAEHPEIYIKIGAFYALGKKQPPYLDLAPMIQKVVKAFGANRCLWESDCPFQVVEHRYEDSIALIRDRLHFLGEDDKRWLLGDTAERILFS